MVFCCYALLGFITTLTAANATHERVSDRMPTGYPMPARIEADPELHRKANELVARWNTVTAVLTLPALLYLVVIEPREEMPLVTAATFAVYGFILVCAAGYPFEKMKHLESETPL